VYRPSILHDGTCSSTRGQTSNDTSFYSTRHGSSLHGRRTSRSHHRDGSRYDPNPGYSVSGRLRTRDPTHTYEPSQGVSSRRLWKHRPLADNAKHHPVSLDPAKLKSCLKQTEGSRSFWKDVTFQAPSAKHNDPRTDNNTRTRDKIYTRQGHQVSVMSTAPRYTDGHLPRRKHRTKHDAPSRWTPSMHSFSRTSRSSPPLRRTKARRRRSSKGKSRHRPIATWYTDLRHVHKGRTTGRGTFKRLGGANEDSNAI
jgi:hypothetical protein